MIHAGAMESPWGIKQFVKPRPDRKNQRRDYVVPVLARYTMRFSELVRLLERNGFKLFKEKGSIRYYSKPGHDKLIRVDYHGSKEVPTGTCRVILKTAGIRETR